MQLASLPVASTAPCDFTAILHPQTNRVNVTRSLPLNLTVALERVAERCEFSTSAQLSVASPDPGALLGRVPNGAARDFLHADIASLARQFGRVLGRDHVQASLFVQRSDGCQKLHADHVTLRLLCTYAGPGTQWLADEDVVRKHLGPSTMGAESANRAVVRRRGALRTCAPGEVLLLKGHAFPGNAGRGAAHRSPPLRGTGASRLVLKIDEGACGC